MRQAILRRAILRLQLYCSLQALRPAGAKGNVYSSASPQMICSGGDRRSDFEQLLCGVASSAPRTTTSSAPSTAAAAARARAGSLLHVRPLRLLCRVAVLHGGDVGGGFRARWRGCRWLEVLLEGLDHLQQPRQRLRDPPCTT